MSLHCERLSALLVSDWEPRSGRDTWLLHSLFSRSAFTERHQCGWHAWLTTGFDVAVLSTNLEKQLISSSDSGFKVWTNNGEVFFRFPCDSTVFLHGTAVL